MKNLYCALLVFAVWFMNPLFANAQSATSELPALQWNFTGYHTLSGNAVEWIYSVLPTENKEYIAVGYTTVPFAGQSSNKPVIMKLDKLGRLVWIKTITAAQEVTGGTSYYDGTGGFAFFEQVVKTPNGYMAAGVVYSKGGPAPDDKRAILTEVDEDGNILTSDLYNAANAEQTWARSIAINAAQTKIYVAGEIIASPATSPKKLEMHISQIDYASRTIDWTYKFGGVTGNSELGGNKVQKIITHPVTGKIYATGFISMPGDNVEKSVINNENITETLFQRNKDMFLVALTPGSNSVTQDYLQTFDKSALNYSTAQHFNESGPFTARTMLTTTLGPVENSTAKNFLHAGVNQDERGFDLEFTQDGNLILVGLVNFVGPYGYNFGNGAHLFYSKLDGFHDKGRTTDNADGYLFDEYTDGDAYLLKLSLSNGSKIWSKNVSHFSSKDFYPQVYQNGRGNYIVSGSTADYDATDYAKPWGYDALVMETPDAPIIPPYTKDLIWRRTVKGGWNEKSKYVAGQEPNMCCFSLMPTADGGFVLGGDNTPYDNNWQATVDRDYFSVNKMAPYCSPNLPFAINTKEYHISTNTTWPNSTVGSTAFIAGKIVVDAGATLTISNATLSFTSSDHLHDFFHFPNGVSSSGAQMNGIVVKPGGKLVITNSTLKGIPDCQIVAAANRYMWDGIVVEGQNLLAQNATNQGLLEITNSTIQDARYGTLADFGYRHLVTQAVVAGDYTSTTGSTRYDATGQSGGGMVHAATTTWKDCRFSVNHQRFAGNALSNANYYSQCNFLATPAGMADPCFYASPTGSRLPSSTFAASWDAQRIKFIGSNFSCDPGFPKDQWPVGLVGVDASYSVIPYGTVGNVFQNLNTGIRLTLLPGQAARSYVITGNTFQNNGYSIDVANSMNGLTIQKNKFFIPLLGNIYRPHAPLSPAIGVRLQACTGYEVSQNQLDQLAGGTDPGNYGIQVSWGASDFASENRIKNNAFNNLLYPSIALQKNSSADGTQGLQWLCNDYLSGNTSAISRISNINPYLPGQGSNGPVPATMRENQGYCVSNQSNPAENRFYTNCPTNLRLSADAAVTQPVNYFYDSDPSKPELNPLCYNAGVYGTSSCSSSPLYEAICNPTGSGTSTDPDESSAALLQVGNTKTQYPEGSDEWNALHTEEHLLVSDLCRYYGSVEQPDSAGDLLITYNRPVEALPFYMIAHNWSAAEAAWNLLATGTAEEQEYKQMTRIAIDLYSNGQSWMDADSATRSWVTTKSMDNTWTGSLALAVAGLLGTQTYAWPIADVGTTLNNVARNANSAETSFQKIPFSSPTENTHFRLYPNPTAGTLTLESTGGGEATLYNLLGARLWQQDFAAGKETVQVPKTLSAGIYLLRFQENSGAVSQTRLVYQP